MEQACLARSDSCRKVRDRATLLMETRSSKSKLSSFGIWYLHSNWGSTIRLAKGMLVRTGGINPTKKKSGSKVSRKQFSPLDLLLRFLRTQLLQPVPMPPILAVVTEDCGAPGCGAGSSAVPNPAEACGSARSSKLEVVFKKRGRGNPGADQRETGSGLPAVPSKQDWAA